jgi:hypothetical protein
MKGFIVFPNEELLGHFLDSPELLPLQLEERFVRSSQDPLIIFNGLSFKELSTVRHLANQFSGSIKESTQYHPLQE